jgi:hypothetical protein
LLKGGNPNGRRSNRVELLAALIELRKLIEEHPGVPGHTVT